jgi:hypothetical protein
LEVNTGPSERQNSSSISPNRKAGGKENSGARIRKSDAKENS